MGPRSSDRGWSNRLAFDDWFTTIERIANDTSIDRRYRILIDRPGTTALTDDFAQQMAV
jgi:hypothetical protein